jgi:thiamine kinase-like enzyme
MEMDEQVDYIESLLDQEQENGTLLGERIVLAYSAKEIQNRVVTHSTLVKMRDHCSELTEILQTLHQSNKDLREALERFPKLIEEDRDGQ